MKILVLASVSLGAGPEDAEWLLWEVSVTVEVWSLSAFGVRCQHSSLGYTVLGGSCATCVSEW